MVWFAKLGWSVLKLH